MALAGSFNIIISALGVSLQGSGGDLLASEGIEPVDIALPAPKAVTDWVKTDANTAAGDLPAGHGFSSGKVDVFWTGGKRYSVDAVIVVNALSLDGGAGDDFPANGNLTVVVCPQTALDVSFDGDNLVLIGAMSTKASLLIFRDGGGAVVGDPIVLRANFPWAWATGIGTNPLSGNAIASASVSNSDTAGTAAFKLTGLQYAA
jgi:hypothetical protein